MSPKSFFIPKKRVFPEFRLERLLGTVFAPTEGCRVCLLIDLEDLSLMKGYGFLDAAGHEIQKKAYEEFYLGLKDGRARRARHDRR